MEIITTWIDNIINILYNLGPSVGVLVIILESIIPVLPLGLFVALNMQAFGSFIGFVLSWASTVVGCLIAYKLSFFLIDKYFKKEKGRKLKKLKGVFENITLPNLVLMIAIPFLPAFLINIACGYYKVEKRKFFIALIIGKLSIVYFWGYIGSTLIESITDITVLIRLIAILVVVFVISKVVSNKLKIN